MNSFFYDSLLSFFTSLLPGILVGVCYDVFRIIRVGDSAKNSNLGDRYARFMPNKLQSITFVSKLIAFNKKISYFLEDIVFWLIASCIEILFIYYIYDGEIRIYSVLLAIFGFFIYHHSLGKFILYFAKHIYLIIRLISAWFLFAVAYPFVQAGKFLYKLANYTYCISILRWKNQSLYRKLQNWSINKQHELLDASLDGFEIKRTELNILR